MSRRGLKIDDVTLLKQYRLGGLKPRKWQDVDHDVEDMLPQSPTTSSTQDAEVRDPMGIGDPYDYTQLDPTVRATTMISSKNFDPKQYLNIIQTNLSYQDLNRGINHLRQSLESRSEAIRILVEDDLDRFVAVKSSTDAVYAEMQEGVLSKEAEFGSNPLKDHLSKATQKADQIFLPVFENASKTDKARATLGVFERSKFLFNLPGSLRESVAQGKYEVALRDYKKGKYLYESRPSQLLSSSVSEESSKRAAVQQHRRILEKVWEQVERVMSDMRSSLLEKLSDTESAKSVDEQERTIEILLELGGPEDPVWVFLDSQHKHILSKLKTTFEQSLKLVEDARAKLPPSPEAKEKVAEHMAMQLNVCLESLNSKQPEILIGQVEGHTVWLAVVSLVKNLSDTIVRSLPLFWKIAKGYMDGRLKKNTSASRRSPAQCRGMALELTQTYIDLLTGFFALSEEVSSPSQTSPVIKSGWITPPTNSITTALFLNRIISSLSGGINEINTVTMEVAQGETLGSGLKGFLESVRWKFTALLARSWKHDARIFYYLENWQTTTSPDEKRTPITIYLNKMESFQRHLTTSAFKLAGGLDADNKSGQVRQNQVSQQYIKKITRSFLDALYAFLDGLVHLASEDSGVDHLFPSQPTGAAALVMEQNNSGGMSPSDAYIQPLNLSDSNTRLLLVVSNLVYVSETLLPTMFNELESAFGLSIADERKNVLEMATSLDRTLFDDYVEKKASAVTTIIRNGILDPTVDWYDMPPPTEVRPYMYDALMYLVSVHAHVSKVARTLLNRALMAIVEIIATECLACFKQIPRFGMGGMLRATLEIEFMHQTLAQFTTENRTQEILVQVYDSISKSYNRRPGDDQIQLFLDGVKKTLSEARKSTGISFMCFRANRGADISRSVTGSTESSGLGAGGGSANASFSSRMSTVSGESLATSTVSSAPSARPRRQRTNVP